MYCIVTEKFKTFIFGFTGCGSVVNNTLKSPKYPNNYPETMDRCAYKVPFPKGMALKINFHDFNTKCG